MKALNILFGHRGRNCVTDVVIDVVNLKKSMCKRGQAEAITLTSPQVSIPIVTVATIPGPAQHACQTLKVNRYSACLVRKQ